MAEDRSRQGRKDAVAQQRRRRDDNGGMPAKRLHIPPEVEQRLKAEGREPRWVNDTNGRILRLTKQDDYDKVEGVEPVQVDFTKEGKPIYAHLLSKPSEFFAEDQQRAEERRRSVEKGFTKAQIPAQAGQEPTPVQGARGAEIYVPSGTSIQTNQIADS